LLGDLRHQRLQFDKLATAQDEASYVERARLSATIESTMARLEVLGISPDQVLEMEGADALEQEEDVLDALLQQLHRQESFDHSEFSNPKSESCWLSTFFQSLWHSRVFHAAFKNLVQPLPRGERGTALYGLQKTWELYENATAAQKYVSVSALVAAWGRGIGDSAEAFAKLDQEPELQAVASLFAMVPVPWTGKVWRMPDLWQLVVAMGVQDAPLIALDLTFPPLDARSVQLLTEGFRVAPLQEPALADMGESHNLVAMICFMERFGHYVVFCRRISNARRWRLFNDLPGLARGVLREVDGWTSLASECARYEFCPKMLLYESSTVAERTVSTELQKRESGRADQCTHM